MRLLVQVLEANDGAQAAGWPAFHKSTVHTSPMMYDLDFDGIQDILLATYDGEILAFRDSVRLVYHCSHFAWCHCHFCFLATWSMTRPCKSAFGHCRKLQSFQHLCSQQAGSWACI